MLCSPNIGQNDARPQTPAGRRSRGTLVARKSFLENWPNFARLVAVYGIDGHRIRVQDVVIWHEEQGQSPEEIVSHFPQLTLAKVHAALGYYREHGNEIRREMQETGAFVAKMKRQHACEPVDQT